MEPERIGGLEDASSFSPAFSSPFSGSTCAVWSRKRTPKILGMVIPPLVPIGSMGLVYLPTFG